MTALEQLGAFIATHKPDAPARAAARLHTADTIGAWIAACGTAEGRALLVFRKDSDALADRVAVNVALTRLSEIDDIHLGAMVTPGAIVVPSALTVAATLPDLAANDVIAAIVAGYEAMIRLGVAIDGPSVLYRGIWPTYFAAPFGTAAVAARLLKLDERQTANALATALIMAAPGVGHHAAPTTARWLAVGYAAGRGLQAAQSAAAGFTSDLKIADGDFLKNIFGLAPNTALLGGGLGTLALAQTSFKPWCAARQTMAATQALKEVMAEGVSADSILRIGVAVLPPHLKMIDHGVTAGDRFSHLTSLQYQMAVAALDPDAAYGLSGPAGAISSALAAFMARIQVRAEEGLLGAGYPQAWPAHVTVTASGRRERSVSHVPGDPARPYSEADVKAKFVRMVSGVLGEQRAGAEFAAALSAVERPSALIDELAKIGAAQTAA
ncbi:MAG: MmgE/PrpD family protein [Hyphomicrobiales bacterium]|nr:MmgE/PrpD family protein [Alphaproteobacteria bacterium]